METTIPLGDLRLLPAWLPLSTPVAVAAVVVLVLWLYRMALPKPLPGIPYNKGIGILGDLPEMMVVKREGNGTRHWFGRMATRHKSALTQFFLKPMAPPVLILTDYREVHDILFRRAREFDRSKRNNTTFGTVIPDHHIAMRSSDPRFKGNKELIKDLMTPAFLIGVCAPLMYKKALYLVDVWSLKAEKAAGRPFEAFKDLHDGAMDIILSVAFGFGDENSPLKLQGDALARGGPAGQHAGRRQRARDIPQGAAPRRRAGAADRVDEPGHHLSRALAHHYALDRQADEPAQALCPQGEGGLGRNRQVRRPAGGHRLQRERFDVRAGPDGAPRDCHSEQGRTEARLQDRPDARRGNYPPAPFFGGRRNND